MTNASVAAGPPGAVTFSSGAQRGEVKPRYDLVVPELLTRLARRYSVGAITYGDTNWRKGLPIPDTFNHIIEHLLHFQQHYLWHLQELSDPIERANFTDNYVAAVDRGGIDDDLAAIAWGLATLMHLMRRGNVNV